MTAPAWEPDPGTEEKMRGAGWIRETEASSPDMAAGITLVLDALTFLADARAEYLTNPEPVDGEMEQEAYLRGQVHTARQLRAMLAGDHPAWGWLPSWTGGDWGSILKAIEKNKIDRWTTVVERRGMAKGIREAVSSVCGPDQPLGEHEVYCVPALTLASKIEAGQWKKPAKADQVPVTVVTVEQHVATRIAADLDQVDAEAANHVRLAYELEGGTIPRDEA